MLDIDAFISDGYAKIEQAEPAPSPMRRGQPWATTRAVPRRSRGWGAPVRWASDLTGQGPFGELVRSPALAAALDRVCGVGGWVPRARWQHPGAVSRTPRPTTIEGGTSTPIRPTRRVVGGDRTSAHGAAAHLALGGRSGRRTDANPSGSHHDVARVLGPDPVDLAEMGPWSTTPALGDR